MGSATKRRIIQHLKSIQCGWEASLATLAFAGTQDQRNQMQLALLYASLRSNCCASSQQSWGTVCADRGLRLLLAICSL